MTLFGDVMTSLSTVTLSVENVFPPQIKYFIAFFLPDKDTKQNVNIRNELNFSHVYRSINNIESLAKFT